MLLHSLHYESQACHATYCASSRILLWSAIWNTSAHHMRGLCVYLLKAKRK